jgi:hypothetical protein
MIQVVLVQSEHGAASIVQCCIHYVSTVYGILKE